MDKNWILTLVLNFSGILSIEQYTTTVVIHDNYTNSKLIYTTVSHTLDWWTWITSVKYHTRKLLSNGLNIANTGSGCPFRYIRHQSPSVVLALHDTRISNQLVLIQRPSRPSASRDLASLRSPHITSSTTGPPRNWEKSDRPRLLQYRSQIQLQDHRWPTSSGSSTHEWRPNGDKSAAGVGGVGSGCALLTSCLSPCQLWLEKKRTHYQ